MKKILFILSAVTLLLVCCEEIKFYAETPEVKFKEFRYNDTTLVFDFIDGDGDLGLYQSDTVGPFHSDSAYYRNLFITYYGYENTVFSEIELKSSPDLRFERIPTPEGNNKTIKGFVEVRLNNSLPLEMPDTFMIKFYIVDRALHESNKDSSGLLTFDELLKSNF